MPETPRYRHGRAEFGRLYLDSLIETAERRVDGHRRARHPLRLWLGERRLQQLQAYRSGRDLPTGTRRPRLPRVWAALAASGYVVVLASVVFLQAVDADPTLVGIADGLALALALVAFLLAVACVPKAQPGQSPAAETADDEEDTPARTLPVFEWLQTDPRS